jgi:hypothetical protein
VGVKANREKMEECNIDTIKEFMQVPYQLFKEQISSDKKKMGNNPGLSGNLVSGQIASPFSVQIGTNIVNPIMEDLESLDT